MAIKQIEIEGIGLVRLVKSSRSKTIRLSVSNGAVRVSMPTWTPYAVGVRFLTQHTEWLVEKLGEVDTNTLVDGQRIGRLHTLRFEHGTGKTTSRTTATSVVVYLHDNETVTSKTVQQRAKKAVIKVLRHEAEIILPPRLKTLADLYGFTYGNVSVKQLKRRWGSCDSHKNIVLNLFMAQLPMDLIDYVLCHELAHTLHMSHGAAFWEELERVMPDAKQRRKRLKQHNPTV